MQSHPDLPALLTAIWERLSTLSDHVQESLIASHESRSETNDRLANIEMQLLNGHHRMNDIERRQRVKKNGTCTGLKSFVEAVAPMKEWAIGVTLMVLAVKGLLSPEDVKAVLLSLLKPGG